MKGEKRRRWEGGYIHRQADGRDLFIIERSVGGKRFHVSTRAHSYKPALAQLQRFEANPEAYRPEGEGGSLILNAELLEQYLDAMAKKGLSRRYIKESGNRLADWRDVWGDRDLRRLDLRADLLSPLERVGGNKARIIIAKAFFSWLRRRALVKNSEDPTLDLLVPQGTPEKHRRRKVVPAPMLLEVHRRLPPVYRDVFALQLATGMHLTEIERFIRGQDAELIRSEGRAIIEVRHKSGYRVHTPITEPAYIEAAERLRARGAVPRWYAKMIRDTSRAAGHQFTYGQVRHSVATHAREMGATPDEIAAFLHHRDKRTTERFYIDLAEPVKGIPVLRLVR